MLQTFYVSWWYKIHQTEERKHKKNGRMGRKHTTKKRERKAQLNKSSNNVSNIIDPAGSKKSM